MAGITFGPKLGLLNNANRNQQYWDQFRQFLQAIDQLVQMSIINATQIVPPTTPNNGDAYLLIGGTPSGVWTGFANYIAVWDTQVTTSGTDTQVPSWVFYLPQPGWVLWNIGLAELLVFNGTSWGPVAASGANFPVNNDITNMTSIAASTTTAGITATTVSSGLPALTITGPTGVFAIGVNDGGGGHTGGITTDATVYCNGFLCSGGITFGGGTSSAQLSINSIQNASPGTPFTVSQAGGGAVALNVLGSGTIYTSMLGFTNYNTQTTVGAAGTAGTVPTKPAFYLPISVGGTTFVIPVFAAS